MAGVRAGDAALDLACGTGDITFELRHAGARAVGLDVTERMIRHARAKRVHDGGGPAFVVGDMMALPFPAGSFHLVTAGYGLRNVPALEPAIAEILRVLKPGGRLVSLDFDRPPQRAIRALYLAYLTVVGGALGWVLHRDPDTYRYIPETIRRYPGAPAVSRLMESTGFRRAEHAPVLFGLMSIHRAVK
jgi:demethylmenaquinone methyltransferase/2-methoxy-6-polyprenyl-1,4-benzoquinol methylase